MKKFALFFAILLLMVLQIHNLSLYNVYRGFDAPEHYKYIVFLQNNHSLPLPEWGWEMYHPPLYYLLAALLPGISFLKLIGYISWLGLMLISFTFFKKTLDSEDSWVGLLLTISVPAVIYLTPQVSNEFFSSVLISAGLVFYIIKKDRLRIKDKIVLGLLLGLAMLAKSTAVILPVAILIDQLIDKKFNLFRVGQALSMTFVLLFLISGWFYIRNNMLYHNPLVSNMDLINPQTPRGDRSSQFWFDLSAFQKMDLFQAHHYSFPGGVYFSFFYDGENTLTPVQKYSLAGNLLILSSVPLFLLSLVGFLRSLRSPKVRVMAIYSIILFASLVFYNFKYPFFFSVKGIYLVSLAVPWAYFVIYGLKKFKKFLIFFYLDLALYEALILKNFWILNSWH